MSTKIEQASGVEHGMQTTLTPTSSAASTSSPKISKFAAKSGFVIPKNKLSGSLVPIFRGSKKPGGSDAASEESSKQVQRKTKWGPDVTHDASVRKGKAFAYQVFLELSQDTSYVPLSSFVFYSYLCLKNCVFRFLSFFVPFQLSGSHFF